MSHMLETMAYVGVKPWLGLGAELSSCQPIEVCAQQAGLDWTIYESPVCFSSRNEANSENMHQFLENKVLYRSDTNAALSVVGQRYKVVQPSEILEFYRDLTEQSDLSSKRLACFGAAGKSGLSRVQDSLRQLKAVTCRMATYF